jgi:sugar phosphate isomerase/epimerase
MSPVSRRKAIQSGIAAGVGVTGFLNFFTEPLWAEPIVMYPGIQLYTVDKELKADASSTLLSLQKIGYREVEGAGFAGLTPKEFRGALEDAGLKCNSMHFFNFGDADPNLLFEQANLLGVHVDDYKAMADLCNQFGANAKHAGLQFAYHNHNSEFKDLGDGKLGYDVFLEATDAELVKLELDCGWMIAAGQDPIKYFERYPDRYRMLHVKDFVRPDKPSTSTQGDERPQGTVLGTGFIQYRPILTAAKAAGVEHFYVEQEPPFIGMTAMEAAKRDYQYLESLSK